MRDKSRIKPFLEELGEIWEKECPDWRFGQLIFNVFNSRDPFYYEEKDFLNAVKNYFGRNGYERVPEEKEEK